TVDVVATPRPYAGDDVDLAPADTDRPPLDAVFAENVDEPAIGALQVSLDGRQVLASFVLENAVDAALMRRIDSGLPSGFTYDLRLVVPRRRWFNRTVVRSAIQVTAMYNAVTREYLINIKHDGTLVESRVVRAWDALVDALTRFEAMPVVMLPETADPATRYRLRVRAQLGAGTTWYVIPTTETTDWAASMPLRLDAEPRIAPAP
ncbi:MAG: DUF4390 domain-containing protein, partial [Acidobacteriota bacterium]